MNSRPIIFLDFDGVLNSQLYFMRKDRKGEPIDENVVKLLNILCEDTKALVVVSSTWRLGRSIDELQCILGDKGFEHQVIGKTLDLRRGEHGDCIHRGNEIEQWIKSHEDIVQAKYYGYSNYLILDDDSDVLYYQRNNFICVDPYCGITPKTVFIGKQILTAGGETNAPF
jgi:hypothetical protein